jgi:hypothetical protein
MPSQNNLERAFKVVDYVYPQPNPLLDFIKQVMPNALHDVFPDSILDKGPEGSILYIGPSGEDIVSVHCTPDKQRVFIIPFVGGSLFKTPDGIEEDKELTLLAISPFKINMELLDEDDQVVGTRDEGKELQERLQALLRACRLQLDPIIAYQNEYSQVLKTAEQWGITWIHTGDHRMLETIPNEPGQYLCGNGPAGLFYKLPGNRFCITLDTRKCCLIRVES